MLISLFAPMLYFWLSLKQKSKISYNHAEQLLLQSHLHGLLWYT